MRRSEMKHTLRVGMVLAALLLSVAEGRCASESEDRWKLLDSSKMGEQFYDLESVTKTPQNTYKVWVEVRVSEEFWEMMGVRTERAHWEIDCDNRMYRTLQRNTTKKEGEYVTKQEVGPWSDIEPDTNPETLYKIFCKTPATKKKPR
jgi:hypothetical protein